MVFGVFDLLHPGHVSFLEQAAECGELIAVVARDRAVFDLKKKMPRRSERLRLKDVKKILKTGRAVLGDLKPGTYTAIHDLQPDIICVGYDQYVLAQDLTKRLRQNKLPKFSIIRLNPYLPEKFKTSLLKNYAE